MKRFLRVLSVAMLLAATGPLSSLAPAAGPENWPQFRGPKGDGHAGDAALPLRWSETENLAWKTPIHDRGWSSPVVWGDQIWLTTATPEGHEMFAVCVDLESGRIVHDVNLFHVAEPEEIHSLNSSASPTPVVEAGRVWVHFGTYGTACLDSNTAEIIWARRDLKCNHYRGPGSSPFIHGELLYLHYDGSDVQYVVALDKHTGRTVWRTDRSTDFGEIDGDFRKAFCTPILIEAGGRRQLISPGSKAAMAYDPASGRELWQVTHVGFSTTARPLFGHGLVFLHTGFGRNAVCAVQPDGRGDVTESHVVWKVSKAVPCKPSSILVGERLFMVDDKGVGTCLAAKTGEVLWRARLGGDYSASPILADGRLYFFNQQGKATVIRPADEFEVLATNELESGCMASPAVVGDAMIVRTETHLYRIEK